MVGGHQVHLLLGHRGRSHRRGRGSKRKCTLPPPTFPDSHFSFEAPPSIVVHHPGPTFGLRLPASAYRYFSLFFDDQLLEGITGEPNPFLVSLGLRKRCHGIDLRCYVAGFISMIAV